VNIPVVRLPLCLLCSLVSLSIFKVNFRIKPNWSNRNESRIIDRSVCRQNYPGFRRWSVFAHRLFLITPKLIIGGCGILLLTKLGGFLFDKWTAGAPFYIMAVLNLIAFIAAIIVILIDCATPKIQLGDEIEEPLLSDPEEP
jgi:hypothetical protein